MKKRTKWIIGIVVVLAILIPLFRGPHIRDFYGRSTLPLHATNVLRGTYVEQTKYIKINKQYADSYVKLDELPDSSIKPYAATINASYSMRGSPKFRSHLSYIYRIISNGDSYESIACPTLKWQIDERDYSYIIKVNENREFFIVHFKRTIDLFKISIEELAQLEWVRVRVDNSQVLKELEGVVE